MVEVFRSFFNSDSRVEMRLMRIAVSLGSVAVSWERFGVVGSFVEVLECAGGRVVEVGRGDVIGERFSWNGGVGES